MEAFGETVAVSVQIVLDIEGGNRLPIPIATAPLEHGQAVGKDDGLL